MSNPEGARQQRILVVEDRREVLQVLERALAGAGYAVITAENAVAALERAVDSAPDLVVLDVGLPDRSGFEVARELRMRAFTRPILMLTARDAVVDKVTGLDAGADDYIVKPFDYEELLARVRALLRRSSIRAAEAVIRIADLSVDTHRREVRRGARLIVLTQKEYALLEYLVRHAGRPVSRDQIAANVWRQEFEASNNIVDVYVNYVRRKIDGVGDEPLVQTIRGVGYMIRDS
ncbi:MAG: response regulator transcription factor [Gemmatimonadota bacterium]